jgi:hypothetical protein
MEIKTFNTMNLIPIGDIRFTFGSVNRIKKGKGIHVNDIHIMCETDRHITKETEKALMKLMKEKGSDLLTDGRDFFTTRGAVITQINHPQFQKELELDKELYGNIFDRIYG